MEKVKLIKVGGGGLELLKNIWFFYSGFYIAPSFV